MTLFLSNIGLYRMVLWVDQRLELLCTMQSCVQREVWHLSSLPLCSLAPAPSSSPLCSHSLVDTLPGLGLLLSRSRVGATVVSLSSTAKDKNVVQTRKPILKQAKTNIFVLWQSVEIWIADLSDQIIFRKYGIRPTNLMTSSDWQSCLGLELWAGQGPASLVPPQCSCWVTPTSSGGSLCSSSSGHPLSGQCWPPSSPRALSWLWRNTCLMETKQSWQSSWSKPSHIF